MSPIDLFYLFLLFAFALGAVVGSFLNVVIYRVPIGLSVVSPGSRCPNCEKAIRWYDNIPIFSWLFLRGRCRNCKTAISPRYAIVEALMGVLSAALWVKVALPHFKSIGANWSVDQPPPIPDISALPWGSVALIFGLYFF